MKRRMTTITLVVFAVAAVTVLVGCKSKPKHTDDYRSSNEPYSGDKNLKWLDELGMLGEHELMRFRVSDQSMGHIKGSFFLGIGDVSGSSGSFDALKFSWSPKGFEGTIMSALPFNRIIIKTVDGQKTPTIRFKYNLDVINSHYEIDGHPDPFNYLIEEARHNPNVLITGNYVVSAVVNISPGDMENELYLPFNRDKAEADELSKKH